MHPDPPEAHVATTPVLIAPSLGRHERAEPLLIPTEQALSYYKADHRKLIELSRTVWAANKGSAGARQVNQLGSLNLSVTHHRLTTSDIRAAEIALQKKRPFSASLYAKLVVSAHLDLQFKLELLRDYMQFSSRRNLATCLERAHWALAELKKVHPGLTVAAAYGEFHSSFGVLAAGLPDNNGADELDRVRREKSASTTDFGYVSELGPGFRLSGFSKPVIMLLELPAHLGDGSYLLDATLREHLRSRLQNFDEWLLMISILGQANLQRWRDTEVMTPDAQRMLDRHYVWLDQYVHERHQQIKHNIAANRPRYADGRSTWNDLNQAIDAIQQPDKISWPAYSINRWNKIRMHFWHLEGMKNDEVAKFEKLASPIPNSLSPFGYEMVFYPENGDINAAKQMRWILDKLGHAGY